MLMSEQTRADVCFRVNPSVNVRRDCPLPLLHGRPLSSLVRQPCSARGGSPVTGDRLRREPAATPAIETCSASGAGYVASVRPHRTSLAPTGGTPVIAARSRSVCWLVLIQQGLASPKATLSAGRHGLLLRATTDTLAMPPSRRTEPPQYLVSDIDGRPATLRGLAWPEARRGSAPAARRWTVRWTVLSAS
jgi:hypothetical protein